MSPSQGLKTVLVRPFEQIREKAARRDVCRWEKGETKRKAAKTTDEQKSRQGTYSNRPRFAHWSGPKKHSQKAQLNLFSRNERLSEASSER